MLIHGLLILLLIHMISLNNSHFSILSHQKVKYDKTSLTSHTAA